MKAFNHLLSKNRQQGEQIRSCENCAPRKKEKMITIKQACLITPLFSSFIISSQHFLFMLNLIYKSPLSSPTTPYIHDQIGKKEEEAIL
jgi:hypothetical protein